MSDATPAAMSEAELEAMLNDSPVLSSYREASQYWHRVAKRLHREYRLLLAAPQPPAADAREMAKHLIGVIRTKFYMNDVAAEEMEPLLAAELQPWAAEREQVATLPRTRDNVLIVPGMKVYWVSEDPKTIDGVTVISIGDGDAEFVSGNEIIGIPLEWACSTRAAALAARAEKGEK